MLHVISGDFKVSPIQLKPSQLMIRKILFWSHLSAGVTAGLFVFTMAATGVLLSFEKQVIEFVDRDMRSVAVPSEARPRSLNDLLESVRRAGYGDPASITVRDEPEAATQVSVGRTKTVYLDPYSGAVLGLSSSRAHEFFSVVERLHRALGAPLGSKSIGRWLTGISNLLFCVLIVFGIFLWLPRKWNWNAVRAVLTFRCGVKGKARDWNWHNVIGIWCAIPLLVIVLTGVVMSFDWANTLLFRITGSAPPTSGRGGGNRSPRADHNAGMGNEPDYDRLFGVAIALDAKWRSITLNVAQNENGPISAAVDAGTGGQPQKRTQYLLQRDTGAVLKKVAFADGSLGQRLRAFVRFGHTGEYGGLLGQAVAAIVSLGACVLVYTGFALALRRLAATLRRRRRNLPPGPNLAEPRATATFEDNSQSFVGVGSAGCPDSRPSR